MSYDFMSVQQLSLIHICRRRGGEHREQREAAEQGERTDAGSFHGEASFRIRKTDRNTFCRSWIQRETGPICRIPLKKVTE